MKNNFQQFEIKSTFKKLPIRVYVKKADLKSKTALILNPGAFETAWGDNNRYKKILLWLQENLSVRPTVIAYQTSRISQDPPSNEESKEEYWRRIFKGKIFDDELEDVNRVYKYILNNNLNISNIYILGFSLGGTLGIILSSKFRQIKKICIVGSGISTKRSYLPVLRGYMKKRVIIEKINKFKNYLKIYQGSDERIVPVNDAVEIFEQAKNCSFVSFTRLKKADHMFYGNNFFGLIYHKNLLKNIKHFFDNNYEL